MALTRPIVLVYQTTQTISVTPGTPSLNCCYVGPAFSIQDYPDDKTSIPTDDFIAAGKTKDSACSDIDGSSEGRPADNADFLVLADAPGHSGIQGTLESASVDLVFDEALIELDQGIDGTGSDGMGGSDPLAANDYRFYSASSDFIANMVMASDRLVLTKNAGADVDTAVFVVKEVEDLHTLILTTVFSSDDITLLGTADINWRVEHELDDEHVDTSLYVTVVGDQITIKTGATGLLVPYTNDSAVDEVDYPVNYAEMYIGSLLLRTDLQSVDTVESPAEILSKIGRTDERNPLAAACSVGLANTTTQVQFFGVPTDDSAGHATAQVNTSGRTDMYAIAPITASITGTSWTSVITGWRNEAVGLDDPEKGKYRIILGSYDILPEDKSSAPSSSTGSTLPDPVNTTLYDVFVDPHADADFLTAAIMSTHLLDIGRSASIESLTVGETLFMDGYAAHALTGVIGGKRLRAAASLGAAVPAQAGDYAVRVPIVDSEGGAYRDRVLSGLTASDDGGSLKLTGTAGDFSNTAAGDVAALTGCGNVANDGHRVDSVGGSGESITLDTATLAEASGSITVHTYRPSALGGFEVEAGALVDTTRRITKGTAFANAVVGDIAIILSSATANNIGVWIVDAVEATGTYIQLGGAGTLVTDGDVNVVIYRTKAARGGASITTRVRLTRLQDNAASFITDVLPGEDIEIPYPDSAGAGYSWDTTTTKWEVATVVNDNILDADLTALQELAPEDYVAGFSGDCPYRISVELNKASQVEELNTITGSMASFRVVMVWPNECTVTDLQNELTGVQSRHHGQYLAAAVGGMVAGLPPHQGFTFITIGGISQVFNSNFYFSDDQITDLAEGGWYVFMQDSESSAPYCALETTTDPAAYETGELMYVKDFDYLALGFKDIMQGFLGRYNLLPETIGILNDAFYTQADAFKGDRHERIGAPLISAEIIILERHATERGRAELYAEVEIPEVLNKIGLHLIA